MCKLGKIYNYISSKLSGKSHCSCFKLISEWPCSLGNARTCTILLQDVGCGVGGPGREIAKFSGASVVGLNCSDYQLERAREHTRKAQLQDLCTYVKVSTVSVCVCVCVCVCIVMTTTVSHRVTFVTWSLRTTPSTVSSVSRPPATPVDSSMSTRRLLECWNQEVCSWTVPGWWLTATTLRILNTSKSMMTLWWVKKKKWLQYAVVRLVPRPIPSF